MTIASLALTMGTVIMALGTEATYRRVIQDSSLRAKPYELIVAANEVSAARTRSLLGAQSAQVAGTATVASTTASVPGSPVDVEPPPQPRYGRPTARAVLGQSGWAGPAERIDMQDESASPQLRGLRRLVKGRVSRPFRHDRRRSGSLR